MNYRLIFISLFILSFNYVSTKDRQKWEKDWKNVGTILIKEGHSEKFNEALFFFEKEHGLSSGVPKKLKNDHQHTNCAGCSDLRYIKFFSSDRADDQDEQKFKKKLKKHKLSIPASYRLKLLARDLKEESDDDSLSPNKRLKKRSASHFLDHLAYKEGRPWLRKKLENNLYKSIGAIIFVAFLTGIKAGKGQPKPQRDELV